MFDREMKLELVGVSGAKRQWTNDEISHTSTVSSKKIKRKRKDCPIKFRLSQLSKDGIQFSFDPLLLTELDDATKWRNQAIDHSVGIVLIRSNGEIVDCDNIGEIIKNKVLSGSLDLKRELYDFLLGTGDSSDQVIDAVRVFESKGGGRNRKLLGGNDLEWWNLDPRRPQYSRRLAFFRRLARPLCVKVCKDESVELYRSKKSVLHMMLKTEEIQEFVLDAILIQICRLESQALCRVGKKFCEMLIRAVCKLLKSDMNVDIQAYQHIRRFVCTLIPTLNERLPHAGHTSNSVQCEIDSTLYKEKIKVWKKYLQVNIGATEMNTSETSAITEEESRQQFKKECRIVLEELKERKLRKSAVYDIRKLKKLKLILNDGRIAENESTFCNTDVQILMSSAIAEEDTGGRFQEKHEATHAAPKKREFWNATNHGVRKLKKLNIFSRLEKLTDNGSTVHDANWQIPKSSAIGETKCHSSLQSVQKPESLPVTKDDSRKSFQDVRICVSNEYSRSVQDVNIRVSSTAVEKESHRAVPDVEIPGSSSVTEKERCLPFQSVRVTIPRAIAEKEHPRTFLDEEMPVSRVVVEKDSLRKFSDEQMSVAERVDRCAFQEVQIPVMTTPAEKNTNSEVQEGAGTHLFSRMSPTINPTGAEVRSRNVQDFQIIVPSAGVAKQGHAPFQNVRITIPSAFAEKESRRLFEEQRNMLLEEHKARKLGNSTSHDVRKLNSRKLPKHARGEDDGSILYISDAEMSLSSFWEKTSFMNAVNASFPRECILGRSRPRFQEIALSREKVDALRDLLFDPDGSLSDAIKHDIDNSSKHGYINFANMVCPLERQDRRWQVPIREHRLGDVVRTRRSAEQILTGIFDPEKEDVYDLGILIGGTEDQSLHHDVARTCVGWIPEERLATDQGGVITGWEIDRLAYNEAMESPNAPSSVLIGMGKQEIFLGVQKDQLIREDGANSTTCTVIGGVKGQIFQIVRENEHLAVIRANPGVMFTGDFPHAGVRNVEVGSYEDDLLKSLNRRIDNVLKNFTESDHQRQSKAIISVLCKFPDLDKLCRLHYSTEIASNKIRFPSNAIGFCDCLVNPPDNRCLSTDPPIERINDDVSDGSIEAKSDVDADQSSEEEVVNSDSSDDDDDDEDDEEWHS